MFRSGWDGMDLVTSSHHVLNLRIRLWQRRDSRQYTTSDDDTDNRPLSRETGTRRCLVEVDPVLHE